MDSKTGLIIQLIGIILMATLSIFLIKSLKSLALKYWTAAWCALATALFALTLAFQFPLLAKSPTVFYFFGEYVFCFFLIAGCQNYATGKRLPASNLKALIPFALLSLVLSLSSGDINKVFSIHTMVMSVAFWFAFLALKDVRPTGKNNYGWYIMRTALLMLAVSFLNYTFIFTLYQLSFAYAPAWLLAYNSIIDLVMEILLGFGMVIVLLEQVRHDLESANRQLKEAHAKLEEAAHTDPLTTAFNRHAFYGFLKKREEVVSGCVGVFDIDNLKPINDRYGHFAGDMAIRAVVRSIRLLIRAEDLIFRWGGDEFFVIMISMNSQMAGERMSELRALLENIKIDGLTKRLTVGVSYGFADFTGVEELEKAVKNADEQMYRAKQENKIKNDADQLMIFQNSQLSNESAVAMS